MAVVARVPRSRGGVSGVLLILIGAWGGLAPFVGPYFRFAYTPDKAWAYTSGRLWLSIVPGAAALLGGLLVTGAAHRAVGCFGAFIAALGGAWFIVGGPVIALAVKSGSISPGAPLTGSLGSLSLATRLFLEQFAFFTGIGVLILFFGALALGRFSVVGVKDAALAEQILSGVPTEGYPSAYGQAPGRIKVPTTPATRPRPARSRVRAAPSSRRNSRRNRPSSTRRRRPTSIPRHRPSSTRRRQARSGRRRRRAPAGFAGPARPARGIWPSPDGAGPTWRNPPCLTYHLIYPWCPCKRRLLGGPTWVTGSTLLRAGRPCQTVLFRHRAGSRIPPGRHHPLGGSSGCPPTARPHRHPLPPRRLRPQHRHLRPQHRHPRPPQRHLSPRRRRLPRLRRRLTRRMASQRPTAVRGRTALAPAHISTVRLSTVRLSTVRRGRRRARASAGSRSHRSCSGCLARSC